MGLGVNLGKLFRRKGTEAGSQPTKSIAPSPVGAPSPSPKPKPRPRPKPRVQDAVPQPVVPERWYQDEALRYLLGRAADAPAVRQVLDLCDAVHGPMPPASWREQMTALLADNAAGISALRTIALREKPFDGPGSDHQVPFVRSVVWAIGLTEPADAVPLLVHLAELYGRPGRGRQYRSVALTAVEALGRVGGERALPALRQLTAEAKLGDVRRAASRELDQVLGEANLSRADVPEWQAETFGLDGNSYRVIMLDSGYVAGITLDEDGTVTLHYRGPGAQRLPRKPPSVHADDRVREAADVVANLRTVVYAERFRLKQLMQDQRTLTYEDWIEYYLDNPVTGRLCRSLLWESPIDGGERWHRFLPVWNATAEQWMQIGQEGVSYVLSPESRIRLVDPKRMTAADRRAWVTRLGRLGLRQPFEQMDLR